jgi:adenine-specific DNA-methyltransferase
MNTFFKSLNGRALRNYFEENRATIRIVDFGTLQIFKSKSTYTCICFIENSYHLVKNTKQDKELLH